MALLISYSLFLMLSNVGYSFESHELVVTPLDEGATKRPTKEINATASIVFNITAERDGLEITKSDSEIALKYWKKDQAKTPAKSFSCTNNDSCKTLFCSGGPIYNIFNEIEYFIKWCEKIYFDVIIEDCAFNKNTIDKYTFSGYFKMTTLTIRNCQLDTIVDNAFNYQSTNELTNITFVKVQLKALNAQTFNGLEAVKNFQLFNVLTQATLPLNANYFLQPMAATLSNLVFQQTEEPDSSNTTYDPTAWLGGGNSATVYRKLLYVDLSGTIFNDTLNGNTFAKLTAVQELRLANCSLSTIARNVFNGILSSLKSLDLRYNRLQTLDGKFLATALGKGISIEFGWNLWNCDCDNVEIIEYMKQVKNNSAAETICATPAELQGVQIGNAQMRCYDSTTVIIIITVTAAISENTTILIDSTDETTIETTESEPNAPPISSTTPINNSTSSVSPVTTTMPTTAVETTDKTTECSPKTSPTISTTPNNNSTTEETTKSSSKSSSTPSTSAINHRTTVIDRTEITTTSSPKASTEALATSPITPVNNSTLPTSLPVTTTVPTTTDDTNEETPESMSTPTTSTTTTIYSTTLSTSSGATSIHRWRW